ncbi:MAG: hypothetical protein ABSG39_07655 [Acidimicrobiales bacterium]
MPPRPADLRDRYHNVGGGGIEIEAVGVEPAGFWAWVRGIV